MGQIVREWMSSPVIFIDADSTVAQALTLMRRRNIHSLMVALSGNDFGIVTSTDIRDKIAGVERDPKTTLGQRDHDNAGHLRRIPTCRSRTARSS